MNDQCWPASAASFAFTLAALLLAGCEQSNSYVPPPPPEVTVSRPTRQSVTNYLQYTGTSKAIESVELRARVKGFLKERLFQEGAEVKKNELLLVIDEEQFQASVEQAQAKLGEAEASLKTAQQSRSREVAAAQLSVDEALLLLARVEETRVRNLLTRNASSREDLDRAQADLKKYAALVESDKAKLEQTRADYDTQILSAQATVAAAKADLRQAEIDLSYCRIKSPIDGRISRSLVDVGNLVGNGEATLLATVVQEDPIYVYMSVSESDLLRFRKQVREGKRVDYKKELVPLDLGLVDEPGFPHRGRLDYADPEVDPTTGTIMARGLFPNPEHVIVSGLFVRVRVALDERKDALLVPERALGADQGGPFLLVVNSRKVVEQRPVKLGAEVDGLRVITENLGPDDQVVINGLQRARPGAQVTPRQAASASPAPAKAASASPVETKGTAPSNPTASKTSHP